MQELYIQCICCGSIFFQFKFLGTSSNFLNQYKIFEPAQNILNWYQMFQPR